MGNTFEVTSGKIRVTDPCYDRDVWCTKVVENCRNGIWVAAINWKDEGLWGNRVGSIEIRHRGAGAGYWMHDSGVDIGVDSGQAGFYDDAFYPENTGEYSDETSLYSKICQGTLGLGYIDRHGVFSCSGYGDGSYNLYYGEDASGEIVALKIVFIGDTDEEDENDDWDDDE